MSHPGGRPSKYDPKFIDEVDRYIAEAEQKRTELPKIESFAIRLGVGKNTLYEWGREHLEFHDALQKIMLYQGQRLIDDGIYNKDANATIVKLLLQNNHGMKERQDQTTNDKDLPAPLLVKFIDDGNTHTD